MASAPIATPGFVVWACAVYTVSLWPVPSPTVANELLALGAAGTALLWLATSWGAAAGEIKVTHIAAVTVAVATLSALMAVVQFIHPSGISGWIEPLTTRGRAFANLRQPNHLALLLAWGLVAAIAVASMANAETTSANARAPARIKRRTHFTRYSPVLHGVLYGAVVLLSSALVLTGSRMAMGFALVFGVWALVDRSLTRTARIVLWLVPAVFTLVAAALWLLHQSGVFTYFGGARLEQLAAGEGSLTGRRAGLWLNTLQMIGQHPWGGVGWGQFNLHYALGPYGTLDRPALPIFTHAHNLPLHLAAELGVPFALAFMLALLGWAWWCRPVWRTPGGQCLGIALLLVGLHSMLELPLWYTYFLLPTLGLMVAATWRRWQLAQPSFPSRKQWSAWRGVSAATGVSLLVLAAALAWDYAKVVPAYSTAPTTKTLEERVARAETAVFFRHAGLYARVVTLPLDASLPQHLPLFQATARHYVDVELMRRWALALVLAGDVEAAEHLAWRLWRYDPKHLAPLQAFVGSQLAQQPTPVAAPQWQAFQRYMAAPTPVNLPLNRLVPG